MTANNLETMLKPTTKMSSVRAKRTVLLFVVPLIIGIIALAIYLHGGRFVETENAYVKADKIGVSVEVSGVVVDVPVAENQAVKAGDVLFQIDPAPFKVSVAKAKAQLQQVATDLNATIASYHEKEAEIASAKTRYDYALREEKRQFNLANQHFTSASNVDHAQESAQLAKEKITILQKELTSLATKLGGDVDRPIESHPSYQAVEAELQQRELDLARTTVRARRDGVVSQVPKMGEYLSVGRMAMVLVTSDHLWIEANFPETDLTHVEKGQQVEITVDTYPNFSWKGTVESLSPATGAEFSIIPPQNATGNWVKIAQRVPVRISIEPQNNAPQLRVGLSAEVSIDTHYQRSLLGLSF